MMGCIISSFATKNNTVHDAPKQSMDNALVVQLDQIGTRIASLKQQQKLNEDKLNQLFKQCTKNTSTKRGKFNKAIWKVSCDSENLVKIESSFHGLFYKIACNQQIIRNDNVFNAIFALSQEMDQIKLESLEEILTNLEMWQRVAEDNFDHKISNTADIVLFQ